MANEVTSWLLPDPALMLYVYALVEEFSQPAVARVALLGVLNTAAVLLTFLWARSVGGVTLGLASAALYATSPWAVYFGRQPWVNAQPFLTVLMLLASTRVLLHRERGWVVPFFAFLGLQMQTHLLGFVLILPAAASILVLPRRWGWRVIPGAVVAAAINAPFALHILEHQGAVTGALAAAPPTAVTNEPLTAPRLALWFISGLHIQDKLVEGAAAFSALGSAQSATFALAAAALVAGTALAVIACIRRQDGWQGLAVALIWTFLPLAAAMAQSRPVYIHYMTSIIPAAFLLVALPFAASQRGHWPVRALGRFALAGVLVVQVMAILAFYRGAEAELAITSSSQSAAERQATLNERERETRQSGIGDLFGLPLRYWQRVADQTQEVVRAREATHLTVLIGISDPYALYVDRRRMALDYLLGNHVVARFPFEGTTLLPLDRPAPVLQLPGTELPRIARGAERAFAVPVPGSREEIRLAVIPPRPLTEQALPRRRLDARFDYGVQLVAIDVPSRLERGEAVLLTSFWTFAGLGPEISRGEHSVFFHLLAGDDQIVTQDDGLGLPSSSWREGDLLIRRTTLTVPTDLGDDRLQLVIGVYDQATKRRLPVTLANGREDDRVLLGPIPVRVP